jgi:SNF2 family DNA or RNA helicase
MMQARKRCVLTATPIKNRLPDIFWLAWWAAGGQEEAHARFPYRNAASEHSDFSNTFMVSERNCTKELKAKAAGKPYQGRFVKLTAEICNVHRLWKLIAPIVLRRRKDECGEALVPRIRKVVRVEMGTAQKAVYQYHLNAEYIDINGQKAIGAQLQALRTVAADPTSVLLQNKGVVTVERACACKGKNKRCADCFGTNKVKVNLPHRSGNVYTPKFAAVLSLIQEIIARNEQVLIGTVFHESHDHLGGLLREANIPFLLADGRTNPKQRGPLMQRFKDAEAPVCLGGLEAIANGHNLDTVNNVIIYAYSWAADLIKQFLDRVWRLTSRKPVNVYVVLCNGTVDRKLEALNWEKTDSIELALDGRLIGERSEEISLAELLNIAREEFDTEDKSVDEAAIQREWPQLKARLADAMSRWTPDVPRRVDSGKLIVDRTTRRPAHAAPSPISHLPSPISPDWRSQMASLAIALKSARTPVHQDDPWAAL